MTKTSKAQQTPAELRDEQLDTARGGATYNAADGSVRTADGSVRTADGSVKPGDGSVKVGVIAIAGR